MSVSSVQHQSNVMPAEAGIQSPGVPLPGFPLPYHVRDKLRGNGTRPQELAVYV
jgi:hypothetical protein